MCNVFVDWLARGDALCTTYILGLGPLVSGEDLVLVTALLRTTDAVDALVSLLGGETL